MEPGDRVVLVDGRDRRTELAAALSDGEFEVRTVADIGALDDHLASAAVDCVVSTYQVPRRDGLEFLGGLHALEAVAERDPDVPRILYTDIINPDIAREAVSLGLFDYIPATTEDSVDRLRNRIHEATAKRRAERRVVELSRVNEVIREVLTVLVHADSHEAVYEEVTETLVATRAYEWAWLGRRTAGGPATLAEAGPVGDSAVEATLAAADWGAVAVITPDSADGRRRAVVPIDDDLALVLATDRREAFSETERNVLRELGETVGYSLDAITAHETLAERETALAAKTERLSAFASVVGHDLRNPLSVASGNLELAKAGETERLDAVESALDRMAELIDDVLALAREGDRSIAVESVALSVAARSAWDGVETDAATFEGPDDAAILADRSQLERLFENLFRNAVEHGGRDAAVTVETTETGFAVADDGPGIPPGERESVFELGVTTADSGTGLGLAIVESIASAHGWSVAVDASDSGGARFEVTGVEFVDES